MNLLTAFITFTTSGKTNWEEFLGEYMGNGSVNNVKSKPIVTRRDVITPKTLAFPVTSIIIFCPTRDAVIRKSAARAPTYKKTINIATKGEYRTQ
jgi:hypothetical protein